MAAATEITIVSEQDSSVPASKKQVSAVSSSSSYSSGDEDQQQHQQHHREAEVKYGYFNKRSWIIALVTFLLLGVIALSVSLPFLLKNRTTNSEETTLTTICKSTRYPDVCLVSLRNSRSHTDPQELLEQVTRAAMSGVNEMLNLTITYKRGDNQSVQANAAFADCVDLLGSAIDELQSSLDEFVQGNYQSEITDIQTWMSAALTYEDTCMDELDDIAQSSPSNDAILHLRKVGKKVRKLLSNALALVNPLVAAWKAAHNQGSQQQEQHWSVGLDRGLVHRPRSVDAIVAQDGSGHFSSIQDALNAAPRLSHQRYIIHIRAGVYKEYITVKPYHTNMVFIGDGQGRTVITGNKNAQQPGITTRTSATVAIEGRNFMARDLTIENTAGPSAGQAVALRVGADQAAFYRCSIQGFQDTLLAHVFRQFYRECAISGTVDFVFGNAAAVFQNCTFLSRVPLHGQQTVVTAQGRSDPAQITGFSFHMCNVSGDFPVYLGRPWKEYARVVWLRSNMDAVVQPTGWLSWEGLGAFGQRTSYFAEYRNFGAGSSLGKRVNWSKVITKSKVARKFTPVNFIAARLWLPRTSVIFDSKL